jgi:hypothetical protein
MDPILSSTVDFDEYINVHLNNRRETPRTSANPRGSSSNAGGKVAAARGSSANGAGSRASAQSTFGHVSTKKENNEHHRLPDSQDFLKLNVSKYGSVLTGSSLQLEGKPAPKVPTKSGTSSKPPVGGSSRLSHATPPAWLQSTETNEYRSVPISIEAARPGSDAVKSEFPSPSLNIPVKHSWKAFVNNNNTGASDANVSLTGHSRSSSAAVSSRTTVHEEAGRDSEPHWMYNINGAGSQKHQHSDSANATRIARPLGLHQSLEYRDTLDESMSMADIDQYLRSLDVPQPPPPRASSGSAPPRGPRGDFLLPVPHNDPRGASGARWEGERKEGERERERERERELSDAESSNRQRGSPTKSIRSPSKYSASAATNVNGVTNSYNSAEFSAGFSVFKSRAILLKRCFDNWRAEWKLSKTVLHSRSCDILENVRYWRLKSFFGAWQLLQWSVSCNKVGTSCAGGVYCFYF